jgi:tetratricopeptide (TPR) repeat protein
MLWLAVPLCANETSVFAHDPQVDRLLAEAKRALVLDRLTTPPEDNALKYIDQALAIAPQNAHALALLDEVVTRYEKLVDKVLKRGEDAMLASAKRARIYRERAGRVMSKHGMEDTTALEHMDRTLAAKGWLESPGEEQRTVASDSTEQVVGELLERHVVLAETFIDKQDIADAAWHTEQADMLASRYGLKESRLAGLKERLATYEPSLEQTEQAAAELAQANTHRRLTELAAFYVASGAAARAEGDVTGALQREQAAQEIIAQYGLSDDMVQRLSTQLQVSPVARIQPAMFRVYGTF